MKPSKPRFVESATKITSANEIDEMLQRARSGEPEAHDEYEEDEHTMMIGNSEELAAKSMMIPDVKVAVGRASTNVIRRTGPVTVPRASSPMPAVPTALGTKSDVDEDDAFAPWDDATHSTAPQAPEALVAAMNAVPAETRPAETRRPEPVLPPPEQDYLPPPMPMQRPVVEAPPIETAPPRKQLSKNMLAWVIMITVMICGGTLAYLRISALEDKLAATQSALDAANARNARAK